MPRESTAVMCAHSRQSIIRENAAPWVLRPKLGMRLSRRVVARWCDSRRSPSWPATLGWLRGVEYGRRGTAPRISRSVSTCRTLSGVLILAASLPGAATAAMSACTVHAIAAAAPVGMTVGSVSDLGLKHPSAGRHGVVYVPANRFGDGAPQYCLITGKVVIDPRTRATANFAAVLPSKTRWNGKFLFEGCGGFCGQMKFWGPPAAAQLKKGFPVWITDDGHQGKPGPGPQFVAADDPSWGRASTPQRNRQLIIDYEYRAVHVVTRLGKAFTRNFYQVPRLTRSYFVGCSDGGREAMVELDRYPRDYDGIIAGAPFFDMANQLVTSADGVLVQLQTAKAEITPRLLREVSRIVGAKCDVTDGVKDGLIQNPAQCSFDPQRDLPVCGKHTSAEICFSAAQVQALEVIFSATYDPAGHVLFPGFTVSDPGYQLGKSFAFGGAPANPRAPNPWSKNPADEPLAWYMGEGILRDILHFGGPGASLRSLGITFTWGKVGGLWNYHAVIPDSVAASLERAAAPGSAVVPAAARAFLDHGGKLIMYHGLSDGLITPYRTIQYYRDLARLYGGSAALRHRAELFLVPGMGHCGGGPGPDYFGQFFAQAGPSGSQPMNARDDVVTALDHWVMWGKRPHELIATRYVGDVIGAPIARRMPLCPYPEEARYRGRGNVDAAKNWYCAPQDRRLEKVGPAGLRAGVNAPLRFAGSSTPRR